MDTETVSPDEAPARERSAVRFILLGGLWLASAALAAGFALELARGALFARPFSPRDLFSPSLPPGERLMGLGILILAVTPALRVLALLFLWLQERDWKFVFVSLAVVAALLAAALFG